MSQKELKRVLSKLGVASRKDSASLIEAGQVSVNGVVIRNPLQPISLTDKIKIANQDVAAKKLEIYALNKPKGYVTTMAKNERRPKVADLMPSHQYLFPVGRLDKASRGLLLFTNDNDFAEHISTSASHVEKIYRVQVKGEFKLEHLAVMKNGLEIDGFKYAVNNVELVRTNPTTSWLEVTLAEGKNREIRKILESFNYEILDLIRVQIGKLKLADLHLEPGESVLVDKQKIV